MPRSDSGDVGLEDLERRLEQVSRLLALLLTRDLKTVEAIRLLGRAKLDRQFIAEVTGSTPDAVSVRLSEARRAARPTPVSAGSTGVSDDVE